MPTSATQVPMVRQPQRTIVVLITDFFEGRDERDLIEPCLRALVTDSWDVDALHHVGWCDSCRAATIALGMHALAAPDASFLRRRAGWLAVAAFAIVAVPLVASQVIDTGSSGNARGGSAAQTAPAVPGDPATTPVSTTPGATTPPVKPVPRSKPASSGGVAGAHGQKALPHTT